MKLKYVAFVKGSDVEFHDWEFRGKWCMFYRTDMSFDFCYDTYKPYKSLKVKRDKVEFKYVWHLTKNERRIKEWFEDLKYKWKYRWKYEIIYYFKYKWRIRDKRFKRR